VAEGECSFSLRIMMITPLVWSYAPCVTPGLTVRYTYPLFLRNRMVPSKMGHPQKNGFVVNI